MATKVNKKKSIDLDPASRFHLYPIHSSYSKARQAALLREEAI